MKKIELPLNRDKIEKLRVWDEILLSGILYTARDVAHKRLLSAITKGKRPPIPLLNQTIYYTGPTPPPPNCIIGSCGPTTSARMDLFTPVLLKAGLKGMIGKGDRSKEVVDAIRKYGAVYFLAIGGAGALLSQRIKEKKIVAYKELGPEAIYELRVENFPVIVGIDYTGRNIFKV